MITASELRDFVHIGRKIVCVGRNYRDHIKELSNKMPDKPVIFLKPTSSYITKGDIKIPPGCSELHHEVELAVVVGQRCEGSNRDDVISKIGGYALALDMTARDLQNEAKSKGLPWSLAKGFDTACPVSGFITKEDLSNPHEAKLWCRVNGDMRQEGNTKDMIWNIPELISFVSQYMTLHPGDVLLTGTPAGVGPVKPGDRIQAGLNDIVTIEFGVTQ